MFYINRKHVIDAKSSAKWLARYANDAKGLSTLKSRRNNCCYTIIKNRVFIKAIKNSKQVKNYLSDMETNTEMWLNVIIS